MLIKEVQVSVQFDPESNTYWVSECSVPGVNLNDDSFDNLVERLPGAIHDMIEMNGHKLAAPQIGLHIRTPEAISRSLVAA